MSTARQAALKALVGIAEDSGERPEHRIQAAHTILSHEYPYSDDVPDAEVVEDDE